MLVLSRFRSEEIVIVLPDGREVRVMVVEIRGDKVRLGITADADVPVHRREILDQIKANGGKRREQNVQEM